MLEKSWRVVEQGAVALLVALTAAMTAVSLAQVIWRYVFDDPLTWSEELARYLFIWVAYLSAWVAWKRRAHIALDAVTYFDAPRVKAASALLVEALVLAFALTTAWISLSLLALTHDQPSAVLEIPMSLVYAGYTAMALLIAGDVLVTWATRARAGRPAATGS